MAVPELLAPELDDPDSWKHAYVYGYDTLPDPTNSSYVLIYYNGRDQWKGASEAVGVSRIEVDMLGEGR